MNKTIRIAEASYVIEADAHRRLDAYLASLRGALKDSADETMADVESHITEILAEQHIQPGDLITDKDVDVIRQQVGDPAQFDENRDAAVRQPKQSTPVRWLIGAAVVVLLAIPMVFYWDRIVPSDIQTATETQDYQRTIANLDVAIESGDLEIRSGTANEVSVERQLKWEDKKPTYSEKWTGERLRISADCPEGQNNCSIDYIVTVPRNVSVIAETQAGNIDIASIDGDLRITSTAGNIEVTEAKGMLSAKTNAGHIAATRLTSIEADVHTDAGNVDLRFLDSPTNVVAKAADGNIDITVPQGQAFQVRAETSSGQRTVAVPQDSTAPRRIDAQTSSGNVTIQNF